MIKTTPKQIAEGTGAINALLSSRLPVKAAYAVSKLAKACNNEMEDFDKRKRQVFLDAGCTTVDKEVPAPIMGNPKATTTINVFTHADPEAMKAVTADAEALMTVDVEINALPLDLDQFGDAELAGNAFYGLEWAMKQG